VSANANEAGKVKGPGGGVCEPNAGALRILGTNQEAARPIYEIPGIALAI